MITCSQVTYQSTQAPLYFWISGSSCFSWCEWIDLTKSSTVNHISLFENFFKKTNKQTNEAVPNRRRSGGDSFSSLRLCRPSNRWLIEIG